MNDNMVSVIITTYKRDSIVLKRAIESVFNQTYKNIELIIVNDAPDFSQRSMIDSLIEEYQGRIKYIVNPKNLGGNAARNIGIKASNGEFIAFLDDDDEFLSKKIQRCVNPFKDDNIGLVYSDMYCLENNKPMRIVKRKYIEPVKQTEQMLWDNFIGGYSSVVIRKSELEKINGLDESLKSYQDMDLFLRLSENCDMFRVSEPLINYYITDDSVSLNPNKKIQGLIKILDKHRVLYEKYIGTRDKKIDSEIMNFCKNGWFNQSFILIKQLYVPSKRFARLRPICIGCLKYIAIRIKK